MSLDPKYANLPWIAHDQPDCYETSDLPESDQHQDDQEEPNDLIDCPSITANDAFTKFQGSRIDGASVDFSDSISKKKRTGYVVDRNEYEIIGEDGKELETPVQKFQRLQHEVRSLVEEVSAVKERVEGTATEDEPVTPAQLSALAEALQQQLADFQLENIVGEEATNLDLSDPDGHVGRRLLLQLNTLKETSSKDDGKSSKAAIGGEGAVTYELLHKPAGDRLADSSKLGSLEQRITRMETMLGASSQKVSTLTADTANRSLTEAVSKLCARSSLLEPGHLDQIEARLSALNHRLQTLTEKKEVLTDADTQARVADLYQLVKKWDGLADTIPTLVERLAALKSLHEQALQFSQALTFVSGEQQSAQASLQSHGDLLKQVDERLQENLQTISDNFQSLDDRMKKLGK